MDSIKLIIDNAQNIIGAVGMILTGLIAIAAIIPGDQPEKSLQKIVNIIAKFSIKK